MTNTGEADLDVRIETPRLLLAGFRQSDFPSHLRWLNSVEVARVLPVPSPVSPELAQTIFDQVLALPIEQGIQLAIWTKHPLRLIGGIGLGGRCRTRYRRRLFMSTATVARTCRA